MTTKYDVSLSVFRSTDGFCKHHQPDHAQREREDWEHVSGTAIPLGGKCFAAWHRLSSWSRSWSCTRSCFALSDVNCKNSVGKRVCVETSFSFSFYFVTGIALRLLILLISRYQLGTHTHARTHALSLSRSLSLSLPPSLTPSSLLFPSSRALYFNKTFLLFIFSLCWLTNRQRLQDLRSKKTGQSQISKESTKRRWFIIPLLENKIYRLKHALALSVLRTAGQFFPKCEVASYYILLFPHRWWNCLRIFLRMIPVKNLLNNKNWNFRYALDSWTPHLLQSWEGTLCLFVCLVGVTNETMWNEGSYWVTLSERC